MRIVIIAGETSGDLLGSGLIHAIRERVPDARFEGIAGPRMLEAGCESLYPMERLSVLGLFESFGRYPELIPVRRRLARRFIADPPDAFVGVDAPDFNLSLELALRRAGIPTVHYVSPTVWAWRRYRIHKIAKAVDLMLTLFPFEADFYREHGVGVRFVGHPLADQIPDAPQAAPARAELGIPASAEVVALLPGSRRLEVDYLAEPMARAAAWMTRRRANLHFVVPLVNAEIRERFESARAAGAADVPMTLVDGRARAAMTAADAVLLASGTASLEALLLKRPMVITYRATNFTYRFGKVVSQVPFVGLPNLLAGRRLVPELLQHEATPERLGSTVLGLLAQPELKRRLQCEFQRIHDSLRHGADGQAADAVLEVAGRR